MIEGGFLLIRGIDARSFLGALSQHGHLFAEVVEAQLVPPVGKYRVSEDSLFQLLKVAVLEKSNLLVGIGTAGKCKFHCPHQFCLGCTPFLDPACH